MGRKNSFIEGFLKTAGLRSWYQNLAAQKAKPGESMKRVLGWGTLAAGTGLYGLHKLTQDPEEKMLRDQQRQNQARY